MIVYASEESLQLITEADNIYFDGIFRSCPQLDTGKRSQSHKKRCVELDRRIKRMIQRFEDETINLETIYQDLVILYVALYLIIDN